MARFMLDMHVRVQDENGRKTGVKFKMIPLGFDCAESLARFFEGASSNGRIWIMEDFAKEIRETSQLVDRAVIAAKKHGKSPKTPCGIASAIIPFLGMAVQAESNNRTVSPPTAQARTTALLGGTKEK